MSAMADTSIVKAASGAPTGAASGDLGGTYPSPTVTSGANHTHTSSQVSDSTAAGRTLLTAATAAAQRTAIAVQDGPRYVPLCGAVTVNATESTVSVGGSPGEIDPAASAITGRTQTWTLCVGARVTTGQTGTVELYDLTAAAVAATITVTSTTAGTEHTASVTLPGSARRYELRASVTGTTTAEYLAILNAALRQSWS